MGFALNEQNQDELNPPLEFGHRRNLALEGEGDEQWLSPNPQTGLVMYLCIEYV